jgi:uncharacterized LabA/DUF88 family protein
MKLTSIYTDAANIILSARSIDFDLDLDLLFQYLYDKFRNCKIVFFIGDVTYLESIRDILTKHEVELVIKQTAREGGKIKANCDVELTNRVSVDVERNLVQKVVLMSGDGDFVALTDYVRDMGKEVSCISVAPKNTAIFIKQRAYLRLMYLVQIKGLLENKKALTKHVT